MKETSVGFEALGSMRLARRGHRLADIHWIDALYRLYVVVFSGVAGVWFLASFVGEFPPGDDAVVKVAQHGAASVGLFAALLFALALRSGFRGGPLAMEHADVHHVLQAPIERRDVLRRPLVHVVRRSVIIGGATGAGFGRVAERGMRRGPITGWIAAVRRPVC